MADTKEIKLSGDRTVKVRKLNALETIKATSFAGSDPSEAVINMVCAVCSVCEINGEPVSPCGSQAQFQSVATQLQQEDIGIIGMLQMREMLDGVPDGDLKNEIMALVGLKSPAPTTTNATADAS